MNRHHIFIDESGTTDVKNHKVSPYFTICGLVISENSRETLKASLNKLKAKHFGSISYILHGENLRWRLRRNSEKINSFARDLEKVLNGTPFSLLFVTFDKEKAFRLGWHNKTLYDRGYKSIVGSLIKFVIAKKVKGDICAEASSPEQDIYLYKSFFHYIANGISNLSITPEAVKQHLTSISFVTKLNNDPEEQLADLLSLCGKLHLQIKKSEIKVEELDPINTVLYSVMQKQMFNNKAKTPRKVLIYNEINPFVEYP